MNIHILKKIIKPRTSIRQCALAVAAMATLTLAPAARAQIQTVPPDLNPGDSYRLVFVTSTTRTASSPNIAHYNTFVSGRAAAVPALAALPTTWKAIGSTAAVNANANTLTRSTDPSAPIYRLDGLRVADGNSDLWNAATNCYNSIPITEAGNAVNVWVWTGQPGTARPGLGMGGSATGAGSLMESQRACTPDREQPYCK